MTTPSVFSDVAANEGQLQPFRGDGAPYPVKATYTIPSGTAGDTVVGMIRVRPGTRILYNNIKIADVDTGTTITADLGVTYDSSTLSTSESVDGFFDALNPQSSGTQSVAHPGASGEAFAHEFVSEGYGYVALKILDSGSGGTTTAGDATLVAMLVDGQAT